MVIDKYDKYDKCSLLSIQSIFYVVCSLLLPLTVFFRYPRHRLLYRSYYHILILLYDIFEPSINVVSLKMPV